MALIFSGVAAPVLESFRGLGIERITSSPARTGVDVAVGVALGSVAV
jgi:hypothetical protein